MKLKTLSALCLAASSLALAAPAMAWESENGQHSTSASVDLSSDYRFRGISFSDNKPAISGSFDYAHASGFYTGIWTTSNSGDGEINIYGGYGNEFGESGVTYDVGVLRYIFPGADEFNNNEIYAGLGYGLFSLGYAFDGDFEGTSEAAHYVSLGFDYDLPAGFAFFASYGTTFFDDDLETITGESSYSDYSIGVATNFAGFDWTLSYIGVDSDGETVYSGPGSYGGLDDSATDDTVVLSIGKTF